MKIVKKISILQKKVSRLKRNGRRIGLVPTMGYLHEGHLSLVRRASKENDVVVVSIFVNPTQFGPHEDLKKYPRDLKKDLRLLKGFCDIVFTPTPKDMYPRDSCTFVEVRGTSDILCGSTRKGHFIGVTTVVAKLFNIVSPDNAYFGQKDAQQAAIIKKMARDLNFPVMVSVLPIVREKDGLAMSSRNVYLSAQERSDAVILFQSLKSAERLAKQGTKDTAKIKGILADFIGRKQLARIDYIEIVDPNTLESLKVIEKEALLLMAVYIGKTRLIDNTILKVK
ncbi:MAG: pantoate--beta-alanine ligase [Candidatus Omnitrophota bacterium]